MLLVKNPQILSILPEIQATLSTLLIVILTKRQENKPKIVDLMVVSYFRTWVIFFVSVSR